MCLRCAALYACHSWSLYACHSWSLCACHSWSLYACHSWSLYACHCIHSQSMEPNVGSKWFLGEEGALTLENIGKSWHKLPWTKCYGLTNKKCYVTVACMVTRNMHSGKQEVKFCQLLWRNSRCIPVIHNFRTSMMNRSLCGTPVFTKRAQGLCDIISGMKRCTPILNCFTVSTARLPSHHLSSRQSH
jgi:hypothetical protein